MTDVVGSTRLWEEHPDQMRLVRKRHEDIIGEAVRQFGGELILEQGEGDSTFSIFQDANSALQAAESVRDRLDREDWPQDIQLRVRAGLHSGVADSVDRTYYGRAVNRAARIRSAGHGGQILLSQATRELLDLEKRNRLTDRGFHRLKDLLEPIHLYELRESDAHFPPLNTLTRTSKSLPSFLTTFCGRAHDVKEVLRLLTQRRFLTLLATGGVGKTRLAVQVAAEVSHDFPGGVVFLPLNASSTPDSVNAQLLAELSLENLEAIPELPLLLILDNCESALKCAAQVSEQWLRSHPSISILATSRERLRVPGESGFQIHPLRVPPQDSQRLSLEELAAIDSVAMFVDRANWIDGNFRLNEENFQTVGAICRKLEGLPLAIELAVPRLKVLSPNDLLERLSHRLKMLRSTGETGESRHQTMRMVLESSFNTLSQGERTAIGALSQVEGPFTFALAEYLLEADDLDASMLLEGLFDKSLLQTSDSGSGAVYMLELIREYAHETCTDPSSREAIRARILRFALLLIENGKADLNLPIMLQALHLCGEHDNDAGIRICTAVWRYWTSKGLLKEGRSCLQRFLASPCADLELFGQALSAAGTLAYYDGDVSEAEDCYRRSLGAYKDCGCNHRASGALSNLGLVYTLQGDFQRARDHFALAVDQLRSGQPGTALSKALINLGMSMLDLGDESAAETTLTEALSLRSGLKESDDAVLLCNLAQLAALRGANGRAAELCRKACDVVLELDGDQPSLLQLLRVSCFVLVRSDQLEAANQVFKQIKSLKGAEVVVENEYDPEMWREVKQKLKECNGPHRPPLQSGTPAELLYILQELLQPLAGEEK